jgi:hypothetical protein
MPVNIAFALPGVIVVVERMFHQDKGFRQVGVSDGLPVERAAFAVKSVVACHHATPASLMELRFSSGMLR